MLLWEVGQGGVSLYHVDSNGMLWVINYVLSVLRPSFVGVCRVVTEKCRLDKSYRLEAVRKISIIA